MESNNKIIGVLNDLIRINNDRVEGYQKAAEDAREVDMDLLAIFHRMADESKQYAAELTAEVVKLGGDPAKGTTAPGKLYRAWMTVKVNFSGKDRHALLQACEFGEDAAQKAYQEALTSDAEMPASIRQIVANQKSSLKTSHDLVKKYRDMHETVK